MTVRRMICHYIILHDSTAHYVYIYMLIYAALRYSAYTCIRTYMYLHKHGIAVRTWKVLYIHICTHIYIYVLICMSCICIRIIYANV